MLFADKYMHYISLIQSCIRIAARFTKHDLHCTAPTCPQHKALLVSSFMRCLQDDMLDCCRNIADRCAVCASVPLLNWAGTPEFKNLQKHYTNLLHQIAVDKSQNESNDVEESLLDEVVEFGGLGSAYSCLYKLKPGGYTSISALELESPSTSSSSLARCFTTDTEQIAAECNRVLSPQLSVRNCDMSALELLLHQAEGCFSCTLSDLLPDEEDAHLAIQSSKDSGLGPDGIAYSAYRAGGTALLSLLH